MNILPAIASLVSTKLLTAIVSAILVIIAGKAAIGMINKNVNKLSVDVTLHKFLMSAAKVLIYFVAFMIVAGSLGFEMSSLVALASVVSAAFALAASGVLSNLFGGILLLVTKPFSVGDYVSICGQEGVVGEVGLLATKLNTVDNKRITVPNSSISSATIVNFSSEGKRRVDLVFNVGYTNDLETVKSAIRAAADKHDLVVDKESTFVRLSSYNSSDISYTLRAWCATADYWTVYFDLLENVKAEFEAAGVKFAYPHVNVITSDK